MSDDSARWQAQARLVANLRQEIENLRLEIEDLRKTFSLEIPIADLFHFTPSEGTLMRLLVNAAPRIVSVDAFMTSMYRREAEAPGEKIIEVHICRMRKKLIPRGFGGIIRRERGAGYFILRPDAERFVRHNEASVTSTSALDFIFGEATA